MRERVVDAAVRLTGEVGWSQVTMARLAEVVGVSHEWKRFRKICGPLFSEPNNRLVWNETVTVMNDLFTNVWGNQKQIIFEHALELTKPVSLRGINFISREIRVRISSKIG